jgi:hypothetical protein
MVGNAVPVDLATVLAKCIMEQIKSKEYPVENMNLIKKVKQVSV